MEPTTQLDRVNEIRERTSRCVCGRFSKNGGNEVEKAEGSISSTSQKNFLELSLFQESPLGCL